MRSLFKSVLSLSVSGALLIILLFLLKLLFRDRISKRWQYYMWLVVIIRLLVPFTLPESPVNTLFQEADRAIVQITAVSGENETEEPHALPERENAAEAHDSYRAEKEASNVISMSAPKNTAVVFRYLWLVWLAGALLLLTQKITVYRDFVNYIKTGCCEVSDINLLNRLAQYGEDVGVKVPVELYVNSCVSSPLLTGFFRPCIVLPTADWSDSYLRYAILHELTHYRHRDMFYKWLVQITLCLHWFNPFVHLMCREISRACELACDETIISRLGTEGRRIYGDMLLNAIGIGGGYHNSVASVTLYENKKMIKERLGAIMNFKKKSLWVTLGSLVLVVSLFAVSTVVGAYAAPAHTDDPFSESDNDSSEDGQVWKDYSVRIGDLTVSLYDDKQDVAAKLEEAGLSYYERKFARTDYDSYYMIDESLCVYFNAGSCVRLRFCDEAFQTARGIHRGDSYSQIIEQYGDSFYHEACIYKGRYDVYRYSFDGYFCEFGIYSDQDEDAIYDENIGSIYNVDIYVPGQSPIYDYGMGGNSSVIGRYPERVQDNLSQYQDAGVKQSLSAD